MRTQLEIDEDMLLEELNNGVISQSEYNEAMRELEREDRDCAEDAARQAYEDELQRW